MGCGGSKADINDTSTEAVRQDSGKHASNSSQSSSSGTVNQDNVPGDKTEHGNPTADPTGPPFGENNAGNADTHNTGSQNSQQLSSSQDNSGTHNASGVSPKADAIVVTSPCETSSQQRDKSASDVTSHDSEQDNVASHPTSSRAVSPRLPDNNGGPQDTTGAMETGNSKGQSGGEEGGEDEDSGMSAAQEKFSAAMRFACCLLEPETLLELASDEVESLSLNRSLPPACNLYRLLSSLPNLKVVDISNNNLGPQGFRALMLALCDNSSITSLNIAGNRADTDSSESVGKMLTCNQCLTFLDVSNNHLGKDYFSRCVGPALARNGSLQVLRCESIGSTDLTALASGLCENTTLEELCINHSTLSEAAAFMEQLTEALKHPACQLHTLHMKNCGLSDGEFQSLAEVLKVNRKLQSINVSANQLSCMTSLLHLLKASARHMNLHTLLADDVSPSDAAEWKPEAGGHSGGHSVLQVLSLSNAALTDAAIKSLVDFLGTAGLPELRDLCLTNNSGVTMEGLNNMVRLATGADCQLERLSWGLNSADGLPSLLATGHLPHLRYLNLRKARTVPAVVGHLSGALAAGGLHTLVLDGIKLAGSEALVELLEKGGDCSLNALSLSSCSLGDKDLEPLHNALRQGLPLHMLKLSANRISDNGVTGLVEALLAQSSHPMKLIDFSNNQIGTKGCNKLSELYQSSSHTSEIHTLNISGNSIAADGLLSLVSLLNNTALLNLHCQGQKVTFGEYDMDAIFESLAKALDLKYTQDGEDITPECCKLPNIPSSLLVKLDNLGGNPGVLGRLLDSSTITTDFAQTRLPYMPLEQALQLAAHFKGYDSANGSCIFSREEWNHIISAEKDAPSWLQLPENLPRAVYVSHLPSSISEVKMEGIMDNEVDAGVLEVYLLKDAVTRKNNGFAWVLMKEENGVKAAVKYMQDGEARVFGQNYVMSGVNVVVDDSSNSEAVEKARQDMALRADNQKAEAAKHRRLIQQSYSESQERHAYRLAHPAYADGRIW